MGSPLYMWSVINWNVIICHLTTLTFCRVLPASSPMKVPKCWEISENNKYLSGQRRIATWQFANLSPDGYGVGWGRVGNWGTMAYVVLGQIFLVMVENECLKKASHWEGIVRHQHGLFPKWFWNCTRWNSPKSLPATQIIPGFQKATTVGKETVLPSCLSHTSSREGKCNDQGSCLWIRVVSTVVQPCNTLIEFLRMLCSLGILWSTSYRTMHFLK
jgi:hypothetical protein